MSVNLELLEALRLATKQNSFDMLMTGEELRKCEAAIANAEVAMCKGHAPGTYVETVPDACDRIVWRNRYYSLPLKQAEPVRLTNEEVGRLFNESGFELNEMREAAEYFASAIEAAALRANGFKVDNQ